MANLGDRIIVLIDMDCFFCQVESRLQPDLQGKPVAVVQYNQWRNGGIIAVNYEARDFGVTRHMRGDEAKEKCPDIALVSVPSLRGKADTSKYRSAGREVVEVLKKHCSVIERASVDEAYLDITELVEKRIAALPPSRSDLIGSLSNTYVVGYCEDETNDEEQRRDGVERWIVEAYAELGDVQARKLAVAGAIVEELRTEIYEISKFRCSAGISYNKILAKLACGLHKPNRQTILPASAIPSLYSTLPVKKVRNLGGKFGSIVVESLGCNVMADLMRYSLQELQKRFDEKTGSWLFNIARGIDNEPVTTRLVCKSIGSSKNFPGKQAIAKLEVLKHWVGELSADVSDRLEQDLEENERRATTLTVSFHYYEQRKLISQSRSCPLKSYKSERIASQSIDLITRSTQKPVAHIGIAAAKFVQAKGSGNFVNFFKSTGPSTSDQTTITETSVNRIIANKPSEIRSKSSNCASVDPECSNSDEMNSKGSDQTEISKNPESTVKSVFARQARSTEETSRASEPFAPTTTILGNSCGTDYTEMPEKPKSKVESFFSRRAQSKHDELNTGEPISPSTAILGSAQCRKALNCDNLKNSFFMNFLKDSKPEVSNETESALSSCTKESSTSAYLENSVKIPIKHKEKSESIDRVQQDEKTAEEDNLLAQLQEIFPDLDNIDRSVVQLLPIELQRVANSYLKTKIARRVQPVKKAAKTKSKANKSNKGSSAPSSFHKFFVNTSPNAGADLSLRKCDECNQMIRIEKYAEHKDFHVAKDLQRMMNQSAAREAAKFTNNSPAKDASMDFPADSSSRKRRLTEETPKTNKKAKDISSFFCA